MTVLSTPAASAAVEQCRIITRDRARNFYYGLKLLPEPERSALFVIYAWMRTADDLVDDASHPAAETRTRLEALRVATVAACAGQPADDDPIMRALADVATRFDLDVTHFHAMIDGQLADLGQVRYERFDDLRRYCEQVASSVGLACISIWGYQDDRAPRRAVDRGIAFQLTNILRDFAEDFGRGRVYLPREDFDRHGLTPEILNAGSDERIEPFLVEQIDRVESYYRAARDLTTMVTPSCRPTLWAMTEIYQGLLRRMRREPERIVRGPRVRLSALTKSAIALKARWQARADR
ncbi:MAG: phytoene/squalene synthase family protein [Phycisphaerales bacterium]|nr:phytoene/squalene synthase family protein [Phycisphaerae bacterium]NNF45000.1 phytoene/squalene synthase family protein [Phycisphaerales bacterium]NNM26053.1 phytoene/squalene synthase family protein [Phycisphaerales bacterium]